MLATDKIQKAFDAIVEETEKALEKEPSKKVAKRLMNILNVAKHQSDVRGATPKSCCTHAKKK